MGRFMTGRDMSAMRHKREVFNSMRKRGVITEHYVQEYHVLCGCGEVGCCFIRGVPTTARTALMQMQLSTPFVEPCSPSGADSA